MEVVALIVAVLGLIPIYFLIKVKARKRYKFDLDYKNITFATFSSPQNPKIDKRFCLIVYVLRIVNCSDESNTLKNVVLSYRFDGKIYQDESYVMHTGTTPQAGEPAIITSNGLDSIIMMGWYDIRPKLAQYEVIQPGGVFSGSAVFLFEPHVNDLHRVENLKLVVADFHGNRLSYPIAIQDGWFQTLEKGIAVIDRPFTVTKDNTIQWN